MRPPRFFHAMEKSFPHYGKLLAGALRFREIFPRYGKKFSTPWKTFGRRASFSQNFSTLWKNIFHSVENVGASRSGARRGAALVVVLWTVLLLSLLIGGMAYEMRIEAGITSFARKRLKAQVAARGGVEYAKFLLAMSFKASAFEEEGEPEETRILAKNLERGIGLTGVNVTMGESSATLDILPESGRRNVNMLSDDDWEELLDQAGAPEESWPDLIDCYKDVIDENDEHRLNGAEKDDEYYKRQEYEPKNAPLDTVDELLLIKNFTPEIVYGGPPADAEGEPLRGIAHLLTTFGDGKVNVNTASREVLLTLTTQRGQMMPDWVVDDLLKYRLGEDGIANTLDDGFKSVGDAISRSGMDPALADRLSVSDRQFVRVVSIGENNGVQFGVWAVFEVGDKRVTPLYWREEQMQ